MSYPALRPGDTYYEQFTFVDSTGTMVVPDALPTVRLYKNGVYDATATAALTVTNLDSATGRYGVSGVISSGYAAGDVVQVRCLGAKSSVNYESVLPPVRLTQWPATAIPNAAAAASGGLPINGSNAGTMTLSALTISNNLTVSGATIHTGNVSMAAGLTITQSTANGSGLSITGNGSGHGIIATGGINGHGVYGLGGATSGNGINAQAQGSGAIGILGASVSSHGIKGTGGGSGTGIFALGGTTGIGFHALGGTTSGSGMKAASGATTGIGFEVVGFGASAGMSVTGGATGNAVELTGGSTSGDGTKVFLTSGVGFNGTLGDSRIAHLDLDLSTVDGHAQDAANNADQARGTVQDGTFGNAALKALMDTAIGDVLAINQSASRTMILATLGTYERPESGSSAFTVELRTYSKATGAAVNADSTPTLTATGSISGSLSANLSAATNPATGVYRWAYTVSSAATIEQVRMDGSATIAAVAYTLSAYTQVADFVAATFTTTDRSNITAIKAKTDLVNAGAAGAIKSDVIYWAGQEADLDVNNEPYVGTAGHLTNAPTSGDLTAAMKTSVAAAVDASTMATRFAGMIALSGPAYRYTAAALALAPSGGGGGGTTKQIQLTVKNTRVG